MTSIRVQFPYLEWPGWDMPECSLTWVQLPNTSEPARKTVTVSVDRETFSDYCSDSPVFRATFVEPPARNINVALKFALREDLVADVVEEACMYAGALKPLQGKTVPRCYGLYAGTREDGQTIACLVLEYWGQCLRQQFRRLSLDTKLRVLNQLGEIHRRGLLHGDFAERNVLEMNGDIRIIDFDQLVDHECHCDMNFRPGGKQPDVATFGCAQLWELCRYMRLWD